VTGASILVVDDAADTREVLQRNLVDGGHRVLTAPDVGAALRILDETPIDLIVTDLKMPKVSGLDLVHHVRDNRPDVEVIMMTGYASIGGAVEAVHAGAVDYLAKPFTDGELLAAVDRALARLADRRAARAEVEVAAPAGLLGRSPAMREVHRTIAKAAATRATVLITGESGTGKELVARAIHYGSARAAAAFVPVNCGAIPEGLIESELFGHVRGAFTGATEARAGFFLTADGGSIFLDEIGDLTQGLQVKLLRALQDGEVTMVGAARPRRVDVRILAATNKALRELVRKGTFREDLFFRLDVLTIDVPPLRDRGDNVLPLRREVRGRDVPSGAAPLGRDSGRAPRVPLARQRARARELDAAPDRPARRRRDRRGRSAAPHAVLGGGGLAGPEVARRGRGRAHPEGPGGGRRQQDASGGDSRPRPQDAPREAQGARRPVIRRCETPRRGDSPRPRPRKSRLS